MTAPFLAAARGETPSHTPIWIMRQAGRYLPEYREVRAGAGGFQEMTRRPDLAAEVTLQPIRRFGMDAAILFSDIMTPLEGMGIDVRFAPGPIIDDPIRSVADVSRLTTLDPHEGVPFVLEACEILANELPENVPLIGFAGAPFTLLCYLIEGQGSKSFVQTRAFMRSELDATRELLDRLAHGMALYLEAQARAGARALMIFDSWVGLLDAPTFRALVRPALERILSHLRPLDVPLLYFPNQGGHLHHEVAGLDADVIGVDWRIPLEDADEALGGEFVLQGNLDPSVLFAPTDALLTAADSVLDAGRSLRRGHIFNLGHGIDKRTDPDQVARLVDRVHAAPVRGADAGAG
ncbi:MAG TPA: uroporphyrinogen decarboxylase [Longimicrobiales bacterium]|nr:uroporphyrinogen decarboxylase [Longimicrobiales bacterium]